ncbi:MAG: TetR/AcrR family transcriptional regulator [Spirochaetales bacterium]|nr:TetR/AcrR family transcriptional regulator [Spirochaetales bacterium]
MEDVLQNLDKEKRDRIINSAIEEFSLYPFSKASTNNIVKNAGISKGLLFHYFGNKNGLYEYISGFVIRKLYKEINDKIDWDNTDIFERIKQVFFTKIQLASVYPQLFSFSIHLFNKENAKSINQTTELYEKYGVNIQEAFTRIYQHNIDFSRFKDADNIGISIDIIRWTIEKYAEEKILTLDLTGGLEIIMKKAADEMNEYINVLKKAFY